MSESPCVRHGCAACCYETQMPVTAEDVARLEALGHPREAFTVRGEDGLLTLRTRDEPRSPCYFLREERCTAYEARPQGCRIYPLVLTPALRLVRDEECPHRREFPMDPAAKRRILDIVARARRA